VEFRTVAARTHYRVLFQGATHTFFELSLDTGKKNQIRAHLAGKGYPLAGDENYRARTDPFGRLALHARTLEFDHPFTGKHMKFEIPEPEEWLLYVRNGDRQPVMPVWFGEYRQNGHMTRDTESYGYNKPADCYPRLSRKETAGLDFIAKGKLRGRR
jgi:23S rRNA pseudouridine1911/1915/1917 synthase